MDKSGFACFDRRDIINSMMTVNFKKDRRGAAANQTLFWVVFGVIVLGFVVLLLTGALDKGVQPKADDSYLVTNITSTSPAVLSACNSGGVGSALACTVDGTLIGYPGYRCAGSCIYDTVTSCMPGPVMPGITTISPPICTTLPGKPVSCNFPGCYRMGSPNSFILPTTPMLIPGNPGPFTPPMTTPTTDCADGTCGGPGQAACAVNNFTAGPDTGDGRTYALDAAAVQECIDNGGSAATCG